MLAIRQFSSLPKRTSNLVGVVILVPFVDVLLLIGGGVKVSLTTGIVSDDDDEDEDDDDDV